MVDVAGLMVDTARHFETLASLRAIVASLPYAKLNVSLACTQTLVFRQVEA